jgi:hypothetical protein
MNSLLVLATEAHGIPGSDWRAQLSVPLGFLIFVGLTYMLVRANLGTRRGYLVTATSLFGFMIVYALFWAFGAPGTPPNTGPQNLPGQELDAYQPVWRPFAGDSLVAEQPEYAVVGGYPNGFSPDPPAQLPADEIQPGIDEIKTFFSTENDEYLPEPPVDSGAIALTDEVMYATAENGYAIIAVPYLATYQPDPNDPTVLIDPVSEDPAPAGAEAGQPVEGAEPYVAFGFFDPGGEYFPSIVVLVLCTLLFLLHAALLWRDEARERREREEDVQVTERVPVDA